MPTTSDGCDQAPTLKNSPTANNLMRNTVMVNGSARTYVLRLPEDYDNTHPYRLILGLHGYGGDAGEVAGNAGYFGLYQRSEGSTVFVAPEGVDNAWSAATDVEFMEALLAQVEQDLCIDLNRVFLEGFSQGGAMVANLACSLPGVFRAVAVHSGGGVQAAADCEPIPYFASLGDENDGVDNFLNTFVSNNGCTAMTPPRSPNGTHQCYDFEDCTPGYPVRWCPYGGGHTAAPMDSGESQSWMPDEVWAFLSQF